MKPLSSEDAFFLYIETPDQHQHILSTMILDLSDQWHNFDVNALIEHYRHKMAARPEFNHTLVNTPFSLTPPVLVEDPDFAIRNHMHHIAVPEPGTLHQLARIVEDIASTALSHRRPLWECWFISGLEDHRMAVVFKSHHCLFDGVHGNQLMSTLFDTTPNATQDAQPPTAYLPGKHAPARWNVIYQALRSQQRYQPHYLDVTTRTLRSIWHRHGLFGRSKAMADLVPAFLESGPRLKINAPITPNRTAGMGSVSLADVKRIKQRLGATVNDVVVAACTLALRNYLIATDDLPAKPLICYQPVSLALKGQHASKPDSGNEVGTMAFKLPVQIEDTRELLRGVTAATAAAKTVFDQSFENLLQSYIAVVPPAVANWALKHYLSQQVIKYAPTSANVVISNIPGPRQPLFVDGAKLEASYIMGPIISGQGPNITFMSYVDQLHFGVQACREQVPDVWLLVDALSEAFETLDTLSRSDQ